MFDKLVLLFLNPLAPQTNQVEYLTLLILYYSASSKEDSKLATILDKVVSARHSKEHGASKTSFTKNFQRLVKSYGLKWARKSCLNMLGFYLLENPDNKHLDFLYKRVDFKLGAYFKWGSFTYAWFDENQIMAEVAPLIICEIPDRFVRVDFSEFYYDDSWVQRGFCAAENIAYDYDYKGKSLDISVEREGLEEYGFARSEAIPLRRRSLNGSTKEDFWEVVKNIKEFGFWNAYKWWEGCEDWYQEKRPEWFDDKFYERARLHKEELEGGARRLLFKRNAAIIDSFVLKLI
ncbi:MAG: hypothetical protein KME29_05140 [Calothrix sp. FI2-JRJ7]|jgi:hypothetical protein|nr:hypothetical protein [Calothrix sp. FI2-JRJ7]